MSGIEILGLTLSAVAGGAINAVAGGGTLVTFPTLLFFKTPPTVANATSTLALVIGTSGGIYGYRQHLDPVRRWLWYFVPVSLMGGLLGSVLLTRTSDKTFSKLVPFLILFATVLFLAQGAFRRLASREAQAGEIPDGTGLSEGSLVGHERREKSSDRSSRRVWWMIVFQFAVAIYGGYFGAGIGILMLASLGFIGLSHIHEMNTLKTILGSLINVVAAIWFIIAGLIDWPKAAVMTGGALLGYFLGSHYAQKIPQTRVRQIITLIGFILSAVTFWQEFFK